MWKAPVIGGHFLIGQSWSKTKIERLKLGDCCEQYDTQLWLIGQKFRKFFTQPMALSNFHELSDGFRGLFKGTEVQSRLIIVN